MLELFKRERIVKQTIYAKDALRILRKKRELTLGEVSKQTGISISKLSLIETKQVPATSQDAESITTVLKK